MSVISPLTSPTHSNPNTPENKDHLDQENSDLWKITIPPSLRTQSALAPLVVFLNPKSGGRWGDKLFRQLMSLLNPIQIYDLSNGGPTQG